MKLYEMTDAINEIYELLCSEEDTGIDVQTLEDTLWAVEGAMEYKIENIAKLILSLKADAEGYTKEYKRLHAKSQAVNNRVDWLKNYVLQAMQSAGKEKINTAIGTVARQKSPARLEITGDVPEAYYYLPAPCIDKDKITRELKAGKAVSNAMLTQGYHLRIR